MTRRASKLDRPLSRWFSAREDAALQRMIFEAWPHRHGGYAVDFAAGIVEWSERTRPDRMERLLDAAEARKP